MKPGFLAVLFVALAAAPALAQKAPVNNGPALTNCFPMGIEPGKTTDVTFYGAKLEGASAVWMGFASSAVLNPDAKNNGTQPTQVSYRITVPADVTPGFYGVRVATKTGITNARILLIDDLPPATEKGGVNATRQTAQALTLPTAVDGICEATASDFYKFTAAAGQRVSIEVVARRLGLPLDPVVRLLDAEGREVAYSDDEADTGADSRLAYKCTTAGEYFIEIRDIRYQGGGMNRYRLRVGDFPLATAPFPLAVQAGGSATLTLTGKHVEGAAPITVTMPQQTPGGQLPLAARFPQGQGSSFITAAAGSANEQVEKEPNDTPETSTAATLTGGLNGKLDKPRDRDYFHFEAKAGERIVFTGQTRSLGSPTDLFLRLYKPDGTVAIEAEDMATEEGTFDYTFAAAGVYKLLVEDVNRRGGPQQSYRVALQPYQPDFALALEVDKYDVPEEGVLAAKVTATRRGYTGPITLAFDGIKDCKLENNVIAEGKTDTTITATLPPALKGGQFAIVNVVGTAKIGNAEFRAVASDLVAIRKTLSGLPYPPAALDGSLGIGVGPVFPAFFELTATDNVLAFEGKPVKLKLAAKKLNGFDDKITLAVEGLPMGVTAKPAAIDKGKKDIEIEIEGAKAPASGKYTFKVIASAAFQNQPKKVVLDQFALQVGPALKVTLAPAGVLGAGGKQKVTLTLANLPAAKEPRQVKLTWKNLQSGVTAPAEATLAPGADKLELELSAAADAALGKILNVSVLASLKVDGQDAAVASDPVAFEVNK